MLSVDVPAATWLSNSSSGTLARFCQLEDWSRVMLRFVAKNLSWRSTGSLQADPSPSASRACYLRILSDLRFVPTLQEHGGCLRLLLVGFATRPRSSHRSPAFAAAFGMLEVRSTSIFG
jgi:hypothetical protein